MTYIEGYLKNIEDEHNDLEAAQDVADQAVATEDEAETADEAVDESEAEIA